jgi:predicted HicB family RNase H-like nuclease
MEVRGTPGGEAWIKATVTEIQIRQDATHYFVRLDGFQSEFKVKAENILFESDSVEMLKAKKQPEEEDPQEEPEEEPQEEPEEAPAPRRRGRPKKATVEGLMAKAEQARIRREAEEAPLWVENDT